jgi:hypothetical protein
VYADITKVDADAVVGRSFLTLDGIHKIVSIHATLSFSSWTELNFFLELSRAFFEEAK